MQIKYNETFLLGKISDDESCTKETLNDNILLFCLTDSKASCLAFSCSLNIWIKQ